VQAHMNPPSDFGPGLYEQPIASLARLARDSSMSVLPAQLGRVPVYRSNVAMMAPWSEPGLPRRASGLSAIDGNAPSAVAVVTVVTRPAR